MNTFSLHVLGGNRTQTPERYYTDDLFQSCLVAETEDALYLLDCGNHTAYALAEQFAGTQQKPIRGIFISHADPDHISGVWSLVAEANHHASADFVVALPLPEGELARCREFLCLVSAPFETRSRIHFESMSLGYEFERHGFRLETLPNDHLRPQTTLPHRRYEPYRDYQPSFSFRVHFGGRTIVYSADYVDALELDPWLRAGADLAILENAHTAPIEMYAATLARYPRLPIIALTHYWHLRGRPEEVTAIAQSLLPDAQVVQTTAGMEFRFDLDRPEVGPRIVPFSERLRTRAPRLFPTVAETEAFCRARGIPLDWFMLGPFDNPRRGEDYIGLDQDHGVGPRPDDGRTFAGKDGREIRWMPLPRRGLRPDGSIGLDQVIGGLECLGYAYARFSVPRTGRYVILAGSDDGCRMRVDGKEVFYLNATKGAQVDEYRIPIDLTAGEHEVLMAVEQRFGAWKFYWRIVPED